MITSLLLICYSDALTIEKQTLGMLQSGIQMPPDYWSVKNVWFSDTIKKLDWC